MTNRIPAEINIGEAIANPAVDFGLLDKKGRKIAYRGVIQKANVRALTEEEKAERMSYYYHPEGVSGDCFRLYYSVTRDGVDFGASQSGEYHQTEAAALKAFNKKAESARKRYAAKPQEKR